MEKNYWVAKSNELINAKYKLSLEEQKIILVLASTIQPEDDELKAYNFRIESFMKLLGVNNARKYTEVPKITKKLMSKVLEVKKDNKITQFHWLSFAEYEKGTGCVTLKFTPELKPYLLRLKKLYTSYRLQNILTLTSKYSLRIYEILKSHEYKKEICLSVNELKYKFEIQDEYQRYNDFKKYVILAAQKEINEKTDIKFDFEEIKKGRKIVEIKFLIQSNSKNQKSLIKTDDDSINITKVIGVMDNLINAKDAISIYEKSGKDLSKIEKAYDLCKNKKIKNLTAYMIKLVSLDYISSPVKTNKSKKANFEQRNYTKDYHKDLEKKLLDRDDYEGEDIELNYEVKFDDEEEFDIEKLL